MFLLALSRRVGGRDVRAPDPWDTLPVLAPAPPLPHPPGGPRLGTPRGCSGRPRPASHKPEQLTQEVRRSTAAEFCCRVAARLEIKPSVQNTRSFPFNWNHVWTLVLLHTYVLLLEGTTGSVTMLPKFGLETFSG